MPTLWKLFLSTVIVGLVAASWGRPGTIATGLGQHTAVSRTPTDLLLSAGLMVFCLALIWFADD